MKKIYAVIAVALVVFILCTCSIFKKSASGKNIMVDYTGTASVDFYPVCPECGHISPLYSANVSDGEYKASHHTCENCYAVYEITIDRK